MTCAQIIEDKLRSFYIFTCSTCIIHVEMSHIVVAISIAIAFYFSFFSGETLAKLGLKMKCSPDLMSEKKCGKDKYVGTDMLYQDSFVRVWNFTLQPGEMSSLHQHDYDFYYVVISPSTLELYGENGDRLFDFKAEGTVGFKLVEEHLVPINNPFPYAVSVPRIHAVKNIGPNSYHEILFESKSKLENTAEPSNRIEKDSSNKNLKL